MNVISFHNLLLSLTMQGLLWTLLLLLLCFAGVYVAELARLGWEYRRDAPQKQTQDPNKQEKKAPAETPQEPVYYIVEKKKRRPKGDGYGDAKPFTFKEG